MERKPLEYQVGHYYNAEDVKVLWHNLRYNGGCWMISDPSGVAGPGATKFSSFATAAASKPGTSPEEADWAGANMEMYEVCEDEKKIRAAEHEERKWSDPAFPADSSSIGEGWR